jgi:hypothetical protein
MAAILSQGFLGAFLILALGILLALLCAGLPRLGSLGETPAGQGPGLTREPAPVVPSGEAAPAPAPAPEVLAAPAAAVEEESLVAAAIALALNLYQGEMGAAVPEPTPPAGGSSPWALSGRWQAMQNRSLRQKR